MAIVLSTVIALSGCGNRKDAKALFTAPQESIEERSEAEANFDTRANDPVNRGNAKTGGGSKTVESKASRANDPANLGNAEAGSGPNDDAKSTRIGPESISQTNQVKAGSAGQTTQVKTPETTTAQPAASAAPATDDLLAKLSEYVRAYLSPTNDPDKNKPQYYIDLSRFLRDRGAVGIMGDGFYEGRQNICVSFRNGIVLEMNFGGRIPYTMDYIWNGGGILASQEEIASDEDLWYYLQGSREYDSDWSRSFQTVSDRSFGYDYNEYFIISPDEEFFRCPDYRDKKDPYSADYHLNVHASFFETFEKVIDPYINLTDYSFQVDPLS